MGFFRPTVDDAVSAFTKAVDKLQRAAENLHEEMHDQQEIIDKAVTRRLVLSREAARAEHLTKKFKDFLN